MWVSGSGTDLRSCFSHLLPALPLLPFFFPPGATGFFFFGVLAADVDMV